jgi:integrase/recombinase XerD
MVGLDVHLQMLRHSYAINMVRNGVDIRRVQLLLGHAGIQTTTFYLQFKIADLREVYNKVEF